MEVLNVSYSVFKDAAVLSNVYYFNTNNTDIIASTNSGAFIFNSLIVESADKLDFVTNIQPTATEVFLEDDTTAKSALESNTISKFDLGDIFIYMGLAQPGSLSSNPAWKISRYTFDINGDPTDERVSDSNVIWDDRVGLSYF